MSNDLSKTGLQFSETSIGVKDIETSADFYKKTFGLVEAESGEGWIKLEDPKENQRLLIRRCDFLSPISLSIELTDYESGVKDLEAQGAKIISSNPGEGFSYGHAESPDGHPFLIWSTGQTCSEQ